jgi:hypothetical protein
MGATFQPSIFTVGMELSPSGNFAVRTVLSPGVSSIQLSDHNTGAINPSEDVRAATRI